MGMGCCREALKTGTQVCVGTREAPSGIARGLFCNRRLKTAGFRGCEDEAPSSEDGGFG